MLHPSLGLQRSTSSLADGRRQAPAPLHPPSLTLTHSLIVAQPPPLVPPVTPQRNSKGKRFRPMDGTFTAVLGTCMQGFVLGQYGMLYALEHPDQVARLCILNTPLALNAKLRPELAAYKAPLPFMRPGNVRGALAYGAACVFLWCWCSR